MSLDIPLNSKYHVWRHLNGPLNYKPTESVWSVYTKSREYSIEHFRTSMGLVQGHDVPKYTTRAANDTRLYQQRVSKRSVDRVQPIRRSRYLFNVPH